MRPRTRDHTMIIEGIVTTRNADGTTNVAPMGPRVDANGELLLRPFSSSQTYKNLRARGEGVFHVTDDVLLIARAAIEPVSPLLCECGGVAVPRLADCVRWQSFRVESADWSERAEIRTATVASESVRDWVGLNRAKHAVIEATILATRVHLIARDEIIRQMQALRPLIEKTAGEAEVAAFELIETYIAESVKSSAIPTECKE